MSEEALQEELGLGDKVEEQVVDDPVVDDPGNKEPEMSDIEIQARDKGWRPKDEFKGNSDEWYGAKHFVEFGDIKKMVRNQSNQISGMKKSYNEDIGNLNSLHRAQMESQKKDLDVRFNTAVEDGNIDQANAIKDEQINVAGQLNALDSMAPQENPQNYQVLLDEWNLDNQWIFDESDPRSKAAHIAFNLASSKGLSLEDKLAFVNDKVTKASAKTRVNPNRNLPSDVSGSSGQSTRRAKKLSMNDMTSDEMKFRAIFPSDESFLKSIENDRKGA